MVLKYRSDASTGSQGTPKLYIGRIVHSKSLKQLEIIHNGVVGVQGDGTIAFVLKSVEPLARIMHENAREGFDKAKVIHLKPSQFLFPGMIDTHLHAPQWPNLALGMDGNLSEWIEKWTDPMEASYSNTDKARRVYADVVRTTLRLGSTTVAYNSSIHIEATKVLAETCFNAGQRAVVGKMSVTVGSTSGNWDASTKESLTGVEEVIKFIKKLDPDGRLVRPSTMPRGGPFCPPELMDGLGKLTTNYDAYVQGHMCETQSDIDRTLSLHQPFKTYTAIYNHHALLTRRSIMAHCIHLQPEDVTALASTGAGIAHCPNSNTCLRDGICSVRNLLDAGIDVALGTDCSAGYMPSIHEAMRAAANVSRHLAMREGNADYVLDFSELVYLATLGGARVLDMMGSVGNFETGKWFDALVVYVGDVVGVDAGLWEEETKENDEAMVKKWVFLGDDRTIREVFVGGRLVAGHDMV